MAWISVHETIKGPKLREFRKRLECSEYEAAGILTYLWLWGLDNATKDGLILSADEDDIVQFISCAGAGCTLEPRKIVEALFSSGWLDWTENGIYIHDWDVWQEQWYKVKENRERDARRKRESRRHKPDIGSSAEPELEVPADGPKDNPPDAPVDSPPDEEGERNGLHEEPKEPSYSTPFEDWWTVYPKKIEKGSAYKKYQARRKDGYSDAELMEAAKNYAAQCKKLKTEKQYIKHPKTFLSESLPFLDFIQKKTQPEVVETASGENPFLRYRGDDK